MPHKDPEARREYERQRYLKRKEWQLERNRRSRAENPELHRRYCRDQYARDPEKSKAKSRDWMARNPDRHRLTQRATEQRRRARGSDFDKDYAAILIGDPCAYCGGPADSIDHLEPVSKGGPGGWPNLTAACRSCNASKGNRSLLDHLRVKASA